ncbi:MAG: hypothetical protein M1832_001945 [Thelocarpon impressellum]|nr:MAG: hypothetical protein M1832_001945 [Thelocarpon impressellum]
MEYNCIHLPLEEVYQKAQLLASKGQCDDVQACVRHLVKERHEKPGLRLYSMLLLANVDPLRGSTGTVAALLKEMDDEGIISDSAVYHNVLKTLAIHPDYVLRNEVLEEMRHRWFGITTEGWHHIVAGLLRDRQYELARDKLEHMRQEGMQIQSWLYDAFSHLLLDVEEIDEVVDMIKYRISQGEAEVSANLWYFLLDTASRCSHHAGTVYAWRSRVEPGYLNPPDGICANVLTTAARHADASLASDVFRVLGNRSTRFELSHYESLIEAHLGGNDVKTALAIFSIMPTAGCIPSESSTRALVRFLRIHPSRPLQALEHLKGLHASGRHVPTAAVNAIIEAAVAQGDLAAGLDHYKMLHTVCTDGPDTATFNLLLRGCSSGRSQASSSSDKGKATALFLYAEMCALGVRPDALTYDRLVLACLTDEAHDCADAFRYVTEMRGCGRGYKLRPGTRAALVRRAVEVRDDRVWDFLAENGADRGLGEWARTKWDEAGRGTNSAPS